MKRPIYPLLGGLLAINGKNYVTLFKLYFMTPTNGICKNCEKSFDVSFNYCPYCGQETANNLTVGVLFSQTIRNYFSIDGRFFKSFIPLMTRPGVLARRFVNGKRRVYLHPAQFYLFSSVVFFFIFSFTVRKVDNEVSRALEQGFNKVVSLDSVSVITDSVGIQSAPKTLLDNPAHTARSDEEMMRVDSVIMDEQKVSNNSFNFRKEVLDSLIAVGAPQNQKLVAMGMKEGAGVLTSKIYIQLLKLYEKKGGGILKTLYDTIPIAMFFLLPLFALLLKLFYWRRGLYAHHLVFSFYFFTFLFTTFSLLILLNTFTDIPMWVDVLIFLYFIAHLMLSLRHFYKSHWLGAFTKGIIISLMYMLIVLPIAMVGVIFISFLLY